MSKREEKYQWHQGKREETDKGQNNPQSHKHVGDGNKKNYSSKRSEGDPTATMLSIGMKEKNEAEVDVGQDHGKKRLKNIIESYFRKRYRYVLKWDLLSHN